ncbi:metal ABC transporter ATP-binding protein [Nitrincola sp. MINF-07-Sa-05]|uniref:metal ABC transporter ATP-binding protein n=1 Tax=Nitrincola salilacus TaxID=3400273 RepID=UPI0039180A97
MGPQIQLQSMSLTLGRVEILKPVTALFQPGQLHAIVGPNGAGKTSLMRCVLGLMPHKGEIRCVWPGKATPVAYVPQQTAFEPALPVTVEEFMLTTLTRLPVQLFRRTKPKLRVIELLRRVGLEHKGHLQLGSLSGGERQRLMFAQALERDSLFWCLDEPMTGLDTDAQALINQEISLLRRQGATLLVIHHDMDWVRRYADQVWLIDGGLKRAGSADAVLQLNLTPLRDEMEAYA